MSIGKGPLFWCFGGRTAVKLTARHWTDRTTSEHSQCDDKETELSRGVHCCRPTLEFRCSATLGVVIRSLRIDYLNRLGVPTRSTQPGERQRARARKQLGGLLSIGHRTSKQGRPEWQLRGLSSKRARSKPPPSLELVARRSRFRLTRLETWRPIEPCCDRLETPTPIYT